MRKLSLSESKGLKGGGPCGKKLCTNDYIPAGASFIGTCSSTYGCISAYVVFINCPGGPGGEVNYTFCSTNL